ncbi:unnamed protein product, partial [Bubo scandiacus]
EKLCEKPSPLSCYCTPPIPLGYVYACSHERKKPLTSRVIETTKRHDPQDMN